MNTQKNTKPTKSNFYILDFLKSLLHIKRIPIIVYLLIDSFFVFWGIRIILSLVFEMNGTSNVLDIVLIIASILIYLASIVLSLSPVGEWVLRLKYDCEEIEDYKIINRIMPIFQEVYTNASSMAKENKRAISENIKLFIQQNEEANAFAIGRNTICITTKLLDLPDEEIKAILAHEFGHIYNKDTDLVLVVSIANLFINITFALIWVVLWIIKAICFVLSLFVGIFADGIGGLITWFSTAIYTFGATVVIGGVQKLWNCIGSLILNYTSRDDEFNADKFAFELGYGNALVNFFKSLPDAYPGTKNNFALAFKRLATIGKSHPATYRRIEEIEKFQDSVETIYPR